MIDVIIVDDEQKARNSLSKLLARYCPDVRVVGVASNVGDALIAIQRFKPQIVFLDIEMPGENGFQLLEESKQVNFEVIFTTAYVEYALKAFRYAALDYLTKPIDFRLLIEAIGRFKEKQNSLYSQERINVLLENMSQTPDTFEKIALPTSKGYRFERISQILYCKANVNYTIVHMFNGQEMLVAKTLKEFSQLLPESIFFRSHKSYLINLNFIDCYNRENDLVSLVDGTEIPLATRLKKAFLERVK